MADGFNQLDQRLADSGYDEGLPASYPPRPDIDERPIQIAHANIWSRFAAVTGLVSALAGAALLAHAIAPSRLGVIGQVGISAWVGVSVAFALLTLILVVIARHSGPVPNRPSVGSAGIILLICGMLLTLAGLLIASSSPKGIIKAPARDDAPIGSPQAMTDGIDKAAGQCASGWHDVSLGGYVGISQAQYCTDTIMAYVVFDNDSAATLAKGPIRARVPDLLSRYGGGLQPQDLWMLTGKRWMVVGSRTQVTEVQGQWGGQVEPFMGRD
ncbi:hypothetical protein [Bifidobacterium asteroides]|uniref:hypothetical protein n=1 Tax=Bifidobacterium asteroides TaxID=1684 RepID=UPI0018DB8278|nr:hypothetical protein [Bifidobacterium asteroides]MBH9984049.1 hypothetical protein [Bifidobacterium asteroides]